jgi:hypothetical protein
MRPLLGAPWVQSYALVFGGRFRGGPSPGRRSRQRSRRTALAGGHWGTGLAAAAHRGRGRDRGHAAARHDTLRLARRSPPRTPAAARATSACAFSGRPVSGSSRLLSLLACAARLDPAPPAWGTIDAAIAGGTHRARGRARGQPRALSLRACPTTSRLAGRCPASGCFAWPLAVRNRPRRPGARLGDAPRAARPVPARVSRRRVARSPGARCCSCRWPRSGAWDGAVWLAPPAPAAWPRLARDRTRRAVRWSARPSLPSPSWKLRLGRRPLSRRRTPRDCPVRN